MTSNQTTQRRVNASSASECYDWPRVDVLCQLVLNLYMLIPAILFCVHTEHITGNLLVTLILILVNSFRHSFCIFLLQKVLFNTWSLNGNLPVKTVCVKGANVAKFIHFDIIIQLDSFIKLTVSQTNHTSGMCFILTAVNLKWIIYICHTLI